MKIAINVMKSIAITIVLGASLFVSQPANACGGRVSPCEPYFDEPKWDPLPPPPAPEPEPDPAPALSNTQSQSQAQSQSVEIENEVIVEQPRKTEIRIVKVEVEKKSSKKKDKKKAEPAKPAPKKKLPATGMDVKVLLSLFAAIGIAMFAVAKFVRRKFAR